jgi:RNA polymerase sigma factor (sigma-70 family)
VEQCSTCKGVGRVIADYEARNQIIISLSAFIWNEALKLAKKNSWDSIHELANELYQTGMARVLTGFIQFNPKRGVRPMTYLGIAAIRAMWFHLKDDKLIRCPNKNYNPKYQPDVDRVKNVKSLNSMYSNEEGDLSSTTIDDSTPFPDDDAARREEHERLHRCINQLDVRRRQIVLMRMQGLTLQIVGKELKITRERVRQLERMAMERLAILIKRDERNVTEKQTA